MDLEKSYRLPNDIGGPMNFSEGYRWNVPVVTYGFERSFVDYFGSNGVVAVESAIALFNAVPPASNINLSNYSYRAWRVNPQAEMLSLLDLKSQTAALLLEQLGLTDSVRYTFCIRDFYAISPGFYGFVITERNFDPSTATTSWAVNGTLYSYQV